MREESPNCNGLVGVGRSICEHPASTTPVHQSVHIPYGFWVLVVLAAVIMVLTALSPLLRRRAPRVWWTLCGYPAAAVRIRWTWRRLTDVQYLSVSKRPALGIVGDMVVRGRALKQIPPRMGLPRWRRGGLLVRVRLHSGQTPEQYQLAAEAMSHAWRMYSVRVTSDARGFVEIRAAAWDPLATPSVPRSLVVELLSAVVGQWEDSTEWTVNLRRVPHWLIVGATRSGKSTLLASLVSAWARQRVALVGIDLKGGMELSLFQARLTALATTRAGAADLLSTLVTMANDRMELCRSVGARSIWELPDKLRPMPVIVLVDELAELYLMATTAEKAEVAQVSTALLRLAQLGAALGLHLVVSGQRVGSDMGVGVTALRAQLGGRVCHRVNDVGTAEMALGDLDKDALAVAQQITAEQQGVAVAFGDDGGWMRARSILTTPEQARRIAERYAHLAPSMGQLGTYQRQAGGTP
ncbi:FtsK/SpoIIIE domain-containing protein [Streptacidiphilus sp. N1-10]|uniref:FtsK/SpoIIIE domain-containing protein n=1 Tax=Streptacidiphilus jeojiensis TaxID=3229225 RepID=A0ABV6XND4_9ACTN